MAFWFPATIGLIIGIYYCIRIKKSCHYKYGKYLIIPTLITHPLLSFYSNPFYPEDFQDRSSELDIKSVESSKKKISCYFLVNCPYCIDAEKKIDAMFQSKKISSVEFIFFAHPETADSLMIKNQFKVPYRTITNPDNFFKYAGRRFPSIQLRKTNTTLSWSGNDVNFSCFDKLMSSDN